MVLRTRRDLSWGRKKYFEILVLNFRIFLSYHSHSQEICFCLITKSLLRLILLPNWFVKVLEIFQRVHLMVLNLKAVLKSNKICKHCNWRNTHKYINKFFKLPFKWPGTFFKGGSKSLKFNYIRNPNKAM